MDWAYWGLQENPFRITLAPDQLTLFPNQAYAAKQIQRAFALGERVAVLMGPTGIGKTTLAQNLVAQFENEGIHSAWAACVPIVSSQALLQMLLADLGQRGTRLDRAIAGRIAALRLRLVETERRLPAMPDVLGGLRQRLEDRALRLDQALPALLAARRVRLGALHLPHPREGIAARRHALALQQGRLRAGLAALFARCAQSVLATRFSPAPVEALLRNRRTALEGLAARLEASSHTAVLARGFVLVEDAHGLPVTSAAAVRPGQGLTLQFQDGRVPAHADRRRGDQRQDSLL